MRNSLDITPYMCYADITIAFAETSTMLTATSFRMFATIATD